MLRRLRRVAELAKQVPAVEEHVQRALIEFDRAVPSLQTMRNVGEHVDVYALDRGRDKTISRRELQIGKWVGTTFHWLGAQLDIERAMTASEELLNAMRNAARER
jgi:hypothetical protein